MTNWEDSYRDHYAVNFTVQVAKVRKLLIKSPNKTCELDTIPTWLLKDCIDQLLPLVTVIINKSLTTSHVPLELKSALIRPVLNRFNLDSDCLGNYRPVSNFSFLSEY